VQPPAIRLMYETLRYSMLARGMRFHRMPLSAGSVVPSLGYLDGRPLYERVQERAVEQGKPLRDEHPPVSVFLHGLGSSIATWSTVLPGIARQAPVVAPDLPGFGRTALPKDSPFASLREHVDTAHAFIDAVSPDAPVQVIGQSLGGWIAGRVAAERPERVSRLTLINASGLMHPQILEQRRLFSPRDEAELTELWERMWFRLPTTFKVLKKQYLELTRTPIVRGFMDTVQEEDFLHPELLARIQAPTLLVWGLADRLIDYSFSRVFRENIPDIRFRPIPECGHVPQRESPEMFLHYVLPWILGAEPPEPDRPGLRVAEEGVSAPAQGARRKGLRPLRRKNASKA
jgi:abhydrolase domain-containing protein 6